MSYRGKDSLPPSMTPAEYDQMVNGGQPGQGGAPGGAPGAQGQHGYQAGYAAPQGYGRPPTQGYARPGTGQAGYPPPQSGYGAAPRPATHGQGRVPPGGAVSQSPYPGGVAMPSPNDPLLAIFRQVDVDNTGSLSEKELRSALVNWDHSRFDPSTVRMMIRMFDTNLSGTIDYNEFKNLWSYLGDWLRLFQQFDADNSGTISYPEYCRALEAFGYRLSPEFVAFLFSSYDRRSRRDISFDMFVQSCISIKRMTDAFRKYDDDQDGVITLSFEQFMFEILRQR
ncbi:EF-hand [Dipodascopsis tothii]|uniref:EF-hand n=1 Tax=Dipodascopsis tothii TaxID=44089 RepID=UPI0034CD4AE3